MICRQACRGIKSAGEGDDRTATPFPAPWHADPVPGGYVVRNANGQALA
jgi:hypothetical protein